MFQTRSHTGCCLLSFGRARRYVYPVGLLAWNLRLLKVSAFLFLSRIINIVFPSIVHSDRLPKSKPLDVIPSHHQQCFEHRFSDEASSLHYVLQRASKTKANHRKHATKLLTPQNAQIVPSSMAVWSYSPELPQHSYVVPPRFAYCQDVAHPVLQVTYKSHKRRPRTPDLLTAINIQLRVESPPLRSR